MKKGDAVLFEYRDKYDRETGTGIIVEEEEGGFYRVVLIESDKKGEWYFTNYEVSIHGSRLTPLGRVISEFGLLF